MTRMRSAILLTTTISSSSRFCCSTITSSSSSVTAAFVPLSCGKRRTPSLSLSSSLSFSSFASSSSSSSLSSLGQSSASSSSTTTSTSTPKTTQEKSIQNSNKNKPSFTIYYNDVYEVKLPPNHRFPMSKYRQVRQLLQSKIYEELTEEEQEKVDCEFRISPLATIEELSTTHCPSYIQRFLMGNMTETEIRNVGFPWSKQGVNRALSSVGGTVAAATSICDTLQKRKEKEKGSANNNNNNATPILLWAAHVAGGTHHAFHDYGEGFCVFSDIAVSANVIRQRFPQLIKRILIIDLDVHQGNGNAVLFQNRNDVMTFSLHCQSNYFSKKEMSDLDVEVPSGCNDETYLATLRHWLNRIDLEGGEYDFVLYQAGVDVLGDDRLGKMNLTDRGVQKRNELVFDFVAKKKKNVPMVITMGGGYPKGDDWRSILECHANVYFQAHQYISNFGNERDMEGEEEEGEGDEVESM